MKLFKKFAVVATAFAMKKGYDLIKDNKEKIKKVYKNVVKEVKEDVSFDDVKKTGMELTKELKEKFNKGIKEVEEVLVKAEKEIKKATSTSKKEETKKSSKKTSTKKTSAKKATKKSVSKSKKTDKTEK